MIAKEYKVIILLGFITFVIFLSGCKGKRNFNPDTSNIKLDVKIERFDKALFSIDSTHWEQGIANVQKQYPEMMEMFTGPLLRMGSIRNPRNSELLRHKFVYDVYEDSVYRDEIKIYTDEKIHELEAGLSQPFKKIKYYFPKDTLPRLYAIISGFGLKCGTYKNSLAIGLDMFLGENYRAYKAEKFDFPGYVIQTFKKEYIISNVLKSIYESKYDEQEYAGKTLLSNIIYAGKCLYFIDAIAGDMQDTIKIEYTAKQLKWCKENEDLIWKNMIDNKVLFSSDQYKVKDYMTPGPFTAAEGVPQESAPRLGEWVGWQIVKKYMDENPSVTLEQLMKEKDVNMILEKSKYKPKAGK